MLQSNAWDAERRQVVANDKLEGHQVSRTEAGPGEPEEVFEEKDVRLKKDDQTMEQLES